MNRLGLLLLLMHCAFSAHVTKIGGRESRIVGGHEAIPYSHPYIVSLQLKILWARLHICGGTIVSKNWVLTAAHCIKESWLIRWLPMDAVAGSHNVERISSQAQILRIKERIAHPDYSGGIGPNDIAMLKTEEPFLFNRYIKPINLPTHSVIKYDSLKLIGWGALRTTFFFPDLPEKLQEVSVTYVPYEECNKAVDAVKDENEENPLDDDYHICTGPLTGGIAACNGDSGGPLVLLTSYRLLETPNDPVEEVIEEDSDDFMYYRYESVLESELRGVNVNTTSQIQTESKDGEIVPVIVGVVSWGVSPCGEKGAPSVYTKVEPYLHFINNLIKT